MGVNWEPLVRVDDDTEQARISVDELVDVPRPQIPKDGSLVEESQVGHILAFFEFWRINLAKLIGLESFFLQVILR